MPKTQLLDKLSILLFITSLSMKLQAQSSMNQNVKYCQYCFDYEERTTEVELSNIYEYPSREYPAYYQKCFNEYEAARDARAQIESQVVSNGKILEPTLRDSQCNESEEKRKEDDAEAIKKMQEIAERKATEQEKDRKTQRVEKLKELHLNLASDANQILPDGWHWVKVVHENNEITEEVVLVKNGKVRERVTTAKSYYTFTDEIHSGNIKDFKTIITIGDSFLDAYFIRYLQEDGKQPEPPSQTEAGLWYDKLKPAYKASLQSKHLYIKGEPLEIPDEPSPEFVKSLKDDLLAKVDWVNLKSRDLGILDLLPNLKSIRVKYFNESVLERLQRIPTLQILDISATDKGRYLRDLSTSRKKKKTLALNSYIQSIKERIPSLQELKYDF